MSVEEGLFARLGLALGARLSMRTPPWISPALSDGELSPDVVAALPARLRAGVNNPVDESESLTARLGKEGVEEAAKAFEAFEKVLRGATNAGSPSQACVWMQGEFGPRFPNEPDRVKVVSVVATIAAAPATAGPSELVGRTKAG